MTRGHAGRATWGKLLMRQLLTGCVLLLTAGAAAGQIMECIDAKGSKTMAQFCPSGTVKENQLTKGGTGSSSAGAPAAKSVAERDVDFKKRTLERQEADAKAAKEASDAKDKERNCQDALSQLRSLQEGQRIARTDPKTGERSFLEDKDRPGEIANARRSVDQWCNKK